MVTQAKSKVMQMPKQSVATPMDLLSQAVANGNIELAEKLMALQERYEKNQARKAFDAAMSSAKAKMPIILKDKVVDFTSQKGRTNYMYEDFSTIYSAVTPVLSKYGLDARFRTISDKESMTVICILSHRDGWHEENSLTAPTDFSGNKNPIQAIGSTQTYLQRYTLKAALGLAASRDDDAQSVSAKTTPKKNPIEPKKILPPHDPATGEVGPHEIANEVDETGKVKWIDYGSKMLACMKSAKDKNEVQKWLDLNKTGLDEMGKEAPKVYKRLMAAIGLK